VFRADIFGTFRPRKDRGVWYRIVGIKVHGSDTCLVIFAEEAKTGNRVCLKFMANEEQWQREIDMRQNADGSLLSSHHVLPLLGHFALDKEAMSYVQSDKRLLGTVLWTHLLILQPAQHDLSDALSHYQIAGRNRQQVVEILYQVAGHLKYMNEGCSRIHGDLVRCGRMHHS
jgi:hypothetical protein